MRGRGLFQILRLKPDNREELLMKARIVVSFAAAAAYFLSAVQTRATLIESWESTLDGWTVQQAPYTPSFVTSPGVTDQSYSLALTGTAGPSYGQMLLGPSTASNTTILAKAVDLSIDVYNLPASFGYYQQWDLDINNADTGYFSVNGYAYDRYGNVGGGGEATLTWTIPAAKRAILASSTSPTQIIFQVGGGYTAGNETMWLDNVRTTDIVPEPASLTLGVLAVGAMTWCGRRKMR
jgi:hypothetical protein